MLDTSARLLQVLSLLQSRRDWTGAELAARLGVTVRTVRRDVDRLRELGYPVHARPGVAGGYRLGAGGVLPPLLLDDDEAVAVAVGLRTAAGGTVAGMEEASVRALAKLDQVLPARLRSRVGALGSSTVPLTPDLPTVDPDVLAQLAAACRDLERVRFDYRDGQGNASGRLVEPHRLVHTGRRWYLVARDVDRDAWRSFRVDRIGAPTATGRRFTPQDPPDPAAFVSRSVSTGPYRYRATVVLHAPLAAVAGRIPPTVGQLEAVDEHTCRLTTGANWLDALAVHLALVGVDFAVVEPPELVAYLGELSARLGRAARESADRASGDLGSDGLASEDRASGDLVSHEVSDALDAGDPSTGGLASDDLGSVERTSASRGGTGRSKGPGPDVTPGPDR